MADRNKLKKLITTASLATIMLGCIESASAVYRQATSVAPNNWDFTGAGLTPSGVIINGESVRYGRDGQSGNSFNLTGTRSLASLNAGGFKDTMFLNGTADFLTIGGIVNPGATKMRVFSGDSTIIFDGSGDAANGVLADNSVSYNALGQLVFDGPGGTINFTMPTAYIFLDGAITSDSIVTQNNTAGTTLNVENSGIAFQGPIAVGGSGPLDNLNFKNSSSSSFSADAEINNITFFNPKTSLYFYDGSNLKGNINGNVAGDGMIYFGGSTKITGNMGGSTPIRFAYLKGPGNVIITGPVGTTEQVTIANDDVTLTIEGDSKTNILFQGNSKFYMNNNLSGNIDFSGYSGKITLGDGFTITGAVDNTVNGCQGILEFQGSGIVDGPVGGTNMLEQINALGAGSVNVGNGNPVGSCIISVADDDAQLRIDGPLQAKEFHFAANGEMTINNNDIGGIGIYAFNGANDGKLTINTDQKLYSYIDGFGTINMNGDHVISLQTPNNDLSGVNFTTENDGEALLAIDMSYAPDPMIIGNVGTSTNKLKTVKFHNDTNVASLYVNDAVIAADKVVNFMGPEVFAKNAITFDGAASVGIFGKYDLNAKLVTNGGGIVHFNDTNIKQDVGSDGVKFSEIRFTSPGMTSNIKGNLYGSLVKIQDNTLNFEQDSIICGDSDIDNSTLNLDKHKLSFLNGMVDIDNSKFHLHAGLGGATPGQLIAGDGSNVVLRGTVGVEVHNLTLLPSNGSEIILAKQDGTGTLDTSNITIANVTGDNAFVQWNVEVRDGLVRLFGNVNIDDDNTCGTLDPDILAAIQGYTPGTDGEQVICDWGNITDPDLRAEAIDRLINKNSKEATEQTMANTARTHHTLIERVQLIDGDDAFLTSPVVTAAPAAGEENGKYGVWSSPFYSHTVKSQENNLSGYRSNTFGVMVGADTMVNHDLTVGGSFTYIDTDIEYRNVKNGDSTKMDSYMLSAYSNYQFTDTWFLQNIATVGLTKVDNKEQRVLSNTTIGIAEAKYDSKLFAVEARVGNNYELNNYNLVMTPALGMIYLESKDDAHSETGSAAHHTHDIGKKSYEKLDAVGSLKITTSPIAYQGFDWKPEMLTVLSYDLLNNADVISRTVPGLNLPEDVTRKPQRLYTAVQLGLSAYKDSIEYGCYINQTFTNHYYNVIGSLNIRINF